MIFNISLCALYLLSLLLQIDEETTIARVRMELLRRSEECDQTDIVEVCPERWMAAMRRTAVKMEPLSFMLILTL